MVAWKDCAKVIMLALVGLIAAVLIYPLLHEIGHALAAVVFGANILDWTLWPAPSTLCDMRGLSMVKQVLIGSGGLLLPIVFSMSIDTRRFWVWYINLVLLGIEILAIIISLIAILRFDLGIPVINEDVTTMLDIAPTYKPVYLAGLTILLISLIMHWRRETPIIRVSEYLGI